MNVSEFYPRRIVKKFLSSGEEIPTVEFLQEISDSLLLFGRNCLIESIEDAVSRYMVECRKNKNAARDFVEQLRKLI